MSIKYSNTNVAIYSHNVCHFIMYIYSDFAQTFKFNIQYRYGYISLVIKIISQLNEMRSSKRNVLNFNLDI